jgi:hypothetical protein
VGSGIAGAFVVLRRGDRRESVPPLCIRGQHPIGGRLAATLARRPDPDGAAWLAWVSASLGSADRAALRAWFALGLDRRQIEALTAQVVMICEAEALATATGRPLRTSGADLATWALAGRSPTVEHMQALDRYGLGSSYSPSVAAADRLHELAGQFPLPPSRTELDGME